MKKGLFISLEGVDAAGKSSHVTAIKDFLEAETGQEVVMTREPGGTELAEKLRNLIKFEEMGAETETLLLNAARRDHLERVILPAIESGKIVICDRFADSTFAYQGGAKKVKKERLLELKEWTHGGVMPDLTMYFDVPLEVSKARRDIRGEGTDRMEKALDENFQALRQVYVELAKDEPKRIKTIDGSPAIENVRSQVLNTLSAFLMARALSNRKPLSPT